MNFVSSIFLSAISMLRGRTVLYQRIERTFVGGNGRMV